MIKEQEIVRRVEGLFALADQLEMRLAKARGQVDKLTPSLLARAFTGKLVPQAPPTYRHRSCWNESKRSMNPSPAGTTENSPAIYRWVIASDRNKSRQGRKNVCELSNDFFRPCGAWSHLGIRCPPLKRLLSVVAAGLLAKARRASAPAVTASFLEPCRVQNRSVDLST